MWYKLFIWMVLLGCTYHPCCGQTSADSLRKPAAAYQKTGGQHYGKSEGKEAIEQFTKAHDLYLQALDFKQAAICLHSIGFAYDEILHDNKKALYYIEKSLPLHHETNDTLELGNMYKYMGMLKGRMGSYTEGKKDVRTAIQYFQLKKYEPGIAVSYFDMAQIFVAEKNADSALHYLGKSKAYWAQQNNTSRLFNINNEFYKIYLSAGMDVEALASLRENEKLDDNPGIYFKDRLIFYNNSIKYYSDKKGTGNDLFYEEKYNSLKDSLVQQGIQID